MVLQPQTGRVPPEADTANPDNPLSTAIHICKQFGIKYPCVKALGINCPIPSATGPINIVSGDKVKETLPTEDIAAADYEKATPEYCAKPGSNFYETLNGTTMFVRVAQQGEDGPLPLSVAFDKHDHAGALLEKLALRFLLMSPGSISVTTSTAAIIEPEAAAAAKVPAAEVPRRPRRPRRTAAAFADLQPGFLLSQ